ncbi:MAG TPA: hypothetical protein VE736_00695 [Gaiellaceae bacterium]|jgi:hypothetical protein|nr:hypothetical protein [Gaiellaceae bacterium]
MRERDRIAQLLGLLRELPCVDSTLFIQVAPETLHSFAGPLHEVRDDEGDAFDSKCVLDIQGDPTTPGTGVTVTLWAPTGERRHLEVA